MLCSGNSSVLILQKTDVRYFSFLQHESSYMAIIGSVKGTPGEKQYASQFISRFFKFFLKLQEYTISAMLDPCEDEDNVVSIKSSIYHLLGIEAARQIMNNLS